jgi:peptidoglycan hydrolase-like protein with peptidoglycan-binding domain
MNRLLTAALAGVLSLSAVAAAQNTNSSTTNTNGNANKIKRGPVFRATKDQIKQVQDILKARGFLSGESTGRLDTAMREGLKKYQGAEGLKVTGTLNAATLQKMNVVLTDKQKAWVAVNAQKTK